MSEYFKASFEFKGAVMQIFNKKLLKSRLLFKKRVNF